MVVAVMLHRNRIFMLFDKDEDDDTDEDDNVEGRPLLCSRVLVLIVGSMLFLFSWCRLIYDCY